MGINFKKLKNKSNDDEFSPVPEGRYNLVVESGELKTSKNDNPMIEFTLKIAEGDHANRKVWHIFSLVEKAQVYLLRFLQAAGSDIIESEGEVEPKDIIKDVVGRNVNGYITVTKNPRSGKKRNEISGNFQPYKSQDTTVSSSGTKSKGSSSGAAAQKKGGKNLFK